MRYQKHTIVCVHHPVRFGIILHYSVQTHKSCSVSSTDTYSAVWNFTHENTSTSTETKQIKERYGMLYSVCTKCQRICPLGRIDSYKLKSGQDSKVRRQHTAFEEVLDQMIEYQHIYLHPTVLMAPSPLPPLHKDSPLKGPPKGPRRGGGAEGGGRRGGHCEGRGLLKCPFARRGDCGRGGVAQSVCTQACCELYLKTQIVRRVAGTVARNWSV